MEPEICPNCNKTFQGELIPEEQRGWFGGKSHFSTVVGLTSIYEDRVFKWLCRNCNHQWDRRDTMTKKSVNYREVKDGFKCNTCAFKADKKAAVASHSRVCPSSKNSPQDTKVTTKTEAKISAQPSCSSITWFVTDLIGVMDVGKVRVNMKISGNSSGWTATWGELKQTFDSLEAAKGEFPKTIEKHILNADKVEKIRKEIDRLQAELNALK